MLTIAKLREYGANVRVGLSLCYEDEFLYLTLVELAVKDKSINKLKVAINQKDYETAYYLANKIKGYYGNLCITPIYLLVKELIESIKNKEENSAISLLKEIISLYRQLIDLL